MCAERLRLRLPDIALFGDILYIDDNAGVWTAIAAITLRQIAFDGINPNKAIVCSTAASTLTWLAPITNTIPWTALYISNGVLYAVDSTTALDTTPMSDDAS
ncbi:hypothetical protein SPRG_02580 [Saprolegnia parasitica CBS 223.65]|uniref:Uncharacterized protein n=1 Tax=Saprolegnia parasitica (strain CBS 223.65) TaxID=695850 RepID=A0A067CQA7_SAPPC|nr:hypothetical protein SPRG_02580 [Saprolegnia parasitica CBS 223.65]KDO32889.1 hypothetical protein SPRG_02580 [Saprolegnia parasitica CBS 223.65]|eukprot:XP_012196539.1 hypothetical protein SPRG_02580 [Saprolegnia parasitica CBS 223.65]